VSDLRSESRGCSMSGRLCAPGTDRISAWDTDSLSAPDMGRDCHPDGLSVGDPLGDWGTHMGVIPGMALLAS
jgi:hypothetical protein